MPFLFYQIVKMLTSYEDKIVIKLLNGEKGLGANKFVEEYLVYKSGAALLLKDLSRTCERCG